MKKLFRWLGRSFPKGEHTSRYTRRDLLVIGLIVIIILQLVLPNPILYRAAYEQGYNERKDFEAIKWNRFFTHLNKVRAEEGLPPIEWEEQ